MVIMAFRRALRRVVITGIGMETPLGTTMPQTWEGLLAGRCGIRKLTTEDTKELSSLTVRIGGKIQKGFSGGKLVKNLQLGEGLVYTCSVCSSTEALKDANWAPKTEEDQLEAGIIIGSSYGPLTTYTNGIEVIITKGYDRLDRLFTMKAFMNIIGGGISSIYSTKGLTHTVSNGSSAGQESIADAFHALQRGEAKVMIAVSADEGVHPFLLSGFEKMGILNVEDNENPLTSSRPFDRSRKGHVLSEGGCALVLEELEHAVNRNARIYAEVKGHATAFDPQSLTRQNEEGEGLRRAIKLALERAGKRPEEVDSVFAQGSGTENGDISEANALVSAFGSKGPMITTMKGHLGDMLAPGSSIEIAAAALAIHHGQVPGILNLKNPLSVGGVVPNFATETRKFSPNTVLATSYGLGGINSALVLSKLV